MIVTFYPHTKNTHNLRVVECEFFRNSKYICFNFFEFQNSFTTYKWGVMYMTYKSKM
jgi:hypothetical protein